MSVHYYVVGYTWCYYSVMFLMSMHSVLNSTVTNVARRNWPHSGQCIWTQGHCGSAAEFSCWC